MLSLTLSLDHNVIDGAPAARFASRLKTLIEAAYGLDALTMPQTTAEQKSELGFR
jgi:hypothetical protein